MAKEILKYALMFLLLVLCQVLVFNHICIFNVAIPLVFIFFVLKLPLNLGINNVMTLSFLMGLVIDTFSNTYGVNALCCTLLAVSRTPVLHLYLPRQEDLPNPEPSARNLGLGVFSKYALTLCLLYAVMYFLVESFTVFNLWLTLLRVVCSAMLTFVIVLAIDGFCNSGRR